MKHEGIGESRAQHMSRRQKWTTLARVLFLFLCLGGGVSYGRAAGLTVTVVSSTFYPTLGSPADALVTATGKVLVSLTASSPPPFPPNSQAGIQVFRPEISGYRNPCGGSKIIGFPIVSLPSGKKSTVRSVFGLKFFPANYDGFPVGYIGAAVEALGVNFFQLTNLDTCAIAGVVNVQQPPVFPPPACKTCAPGSFDVAFTPNGLNAFVANEYGQAPPIDIKGSGTIGVVKVALDAAGRFTNQTKLIDVAPYIYVEGGGAIPGMTISHNGKYLFVTSEVARADFHNPTRIVNPILVHKATGRNPCIGDSTNGPPPKTANGLLTVIDVEAAIAGKGQAAIIQSIAAACSPVRVVESADGKLIWVTARASDKILVFDLPKLVSKSTKVNQSFVGHVYSGGSLPVGETLFYNDQLLAVANSNRYNVKPDSDNVAIFDVSDPAAMRLLATIPAYKRSNHLTSFPRNVTLGPDGYTLFVPNFDASQLQIIKTSVKP